MAVRECRLWAQALAEPCNTLSSSDEPHQSISTPSKAIASDSITSVFSIAFSGV